MTISQAKHRLQEARILARLIKREIDQLRSFIISKGGNPDQQKDFTKRNLDIYNQWKAGKSLAALAKEYNLSISRIYSICKIQHIKSVKQPK